MSAEEIALRLRIDDITSNVASILEQVTHLSSGLREDPTAYRYQSEYAAQARYWAANLLERVTELALLTRQREERRREAEEDDDLPF